jgi:Cytochrome P460
MPWKSTYHLFRRASHLLATVGAAIVIVGCSKRSEGTGFAKDSRVSRATFSRGGEVQLPLSYRQWVHVGTSVKFKGMNVLDGTPITSPEMLDAYVEPSAMAVFEKTGNWPDGAQIVKEYSAVQMDEGNEPQARISSTAFGSSIAQAHYDGLAMMVKDAKRFPNMPGNWAYFSFGHKPPPYDSTANVLPAEQCESCHIKLAADTDYVVSRAHIGLAWKIRK